MIHMGEVLGVFLLWLAFMTVVSIYAVRIGLLLRRQALTERAYRLQLAARHGRIAREATGPIES